MAKTYQSNDYIKFTEPHVKLPHLQASYTQLNSCHASGSAVDPHTPFPFDITFTQYHLFIFIFIFPLLSIGA